MSTEYQKLKSNDPRPQQKKKLEDIMKDLWLNMGQEEELRPYGEPPSGDIDPPSLLRL